jgi:coenzyme F420-0:L-glutamate ligase/coenzyme F420-1:gamma-L-glutamate ligase
VAASLPEVRIVPLRDLPEVRPGHDLAALLAEAAGRGVGGLADGDIVVVTHKVVAKAEGCLVALRTVQPSAFAQAYAERWGKDARQVEVVLRESARIVRMDHGVMICETRHGFVCANAGVDRSNAGAEETVVTLPPDPDASARRLREALINRARKRLAVVVSDTFGRPWRDGLTNVAIGCSGLHPLRDERGQVDAQGYRLEASVLAVADELASAAELAMGKLGGVPAALIRGYEYQDGEGSARELVRAPEKDIFR